MFLLSSYNIVNNVWCRIEDKVSEYLNTTYIVLHILSPTRDYNKSFPGCAFYVQFSTRMNTYKFLLCGF